MLFQLSTFITICAGFSSTSITNSSSIQNYSTQQNALYTATRSIGSESINIIEDRTHKTVLCNLDTVITSKSYIFHTPNYISFKTERSTIHLNLQYYELYNKIVTLLIIKEIPRDTNATTSIIQFRMPGKIDSFNMFDISIFEKNNYFTLKLPRHYLEA